MRVWQGRPYPLGASWDGSGVNFALFSEHGAAVDLCLFDSVDAKTEAARIRLTERKDMPLLDTDQLPDEWDTLRPQIKYQLGGRSVAVLRLASPVVEDTKPEQVDHVAPEVVAAVNMLQNEAAPNHAAGASLARP